MILKLHAHFKYFSPNVFSVTLQVIRYGLQNGFLCVELFCEQHESNCESNSSILKKYTNGIKFLFEYMK